ncbi:DNA-(apurinic or apyrimidinic site) lyase [Taxawa tesnikishii (nom. ined.)]|nr:DNA-(apurinic or apyrimidinic site) lyase [Dothideales sp. JES 119]
MPKRSLIRAASEESSALSSAPSDVASVSGSVVLEPARKRRTKTTAVEEETLVPGELQQDDTTPAITAKPRAARKRKAVEVKEEEEAAEEADGETKPKRRRKAKAVNPNRATEAQSNGNGEPMFIGAHVSSAGGVHNAVTNSVHIGANAFALFLKSQRKWANPPLDPSHCDTFHANCGSHAYDSRRHVLPHGSYLVNLAHTDPARTAQAYHAFVDDLHRCAELGIRLYNFHPGNALQNERSVAIAQLAKNLNRAHKETVDDLRDIIALIEDKARVGVCLDTCHVFAAGYDLRTPEALRITLEKFDETIGMKYLRAIHLNDSKAPFNSHRDLHANIGTGFLGLRAFHAIMREPSFEGLPLVLETPIQLVKDEKGKDREDKAIWAREIKMLESFVGLEVESAEFTDMEEKLREDEGEGGGEEGEEEGEKEKKKNKKGKEMDEEEVESDSSGLSELDDGSEEEKVREGLV